MSLIELLLGAIMLLGGGLFYFKRQSDNNRRDAILGETKGEDKQLKKQQDKVDKKIRLVEDSNDSKLSPEDRAKRWEK